MSFSAISIIPGALHLVSLPMHKLADVTNPLLNVLLHASNTNFFSFTHSPDGITIILPADKLSLFPEGCVTTSTYCWRVLRVSLGSSGCNESGIVSRLSKMLSDHHINIHYLSTYSTDFILIPEQKVMKAVRCLQDNNVDVTWEEDEETCEIIRICKEQSHPAREAPPTSADGSTLVTLQSQLYIANLKKQDYQSCIQAILKLVFFPTKEDNFFSFTEVDNEISMMVDSESIKELKNNKHIMIDEDCWRVVKRYSKLSLEETGIVYSISNPLAKADISLLYLSTYYSSYIMVRAEKFVESTTLLRQGGFDVTVAGA